MNFTTTTTPLEKIKTDLLLIRLFEGEARLEPKILALDQSLDGLISEVVGYGDFTGKNGQNLLLFTASKAMARRVLVLGLGKRGEYTQDKLRLAIASAGLQRQKIEDLAIAPCQTLPRRANLETESQTIVECLLLGGYRFTEYKSTETENQPWALKNIQFALRNQKDKTAVQRGIKTGETLASAVAYARNLGNHPANVATPTHLAKHAVKLQEEYPGQIKTKILNRAEMKKERMETVLAVSRGSEEEPKFIIMEYHGGKNKPTVALVGKGITFDSGGISIKPADKMEEMKFDMAGAATVMGIIKAAAELKLNINLVALIPATENLVSGRAIKPGDIIHSRNGKTIEIVNTDAEGRLVLADALDFAKVYKPDMVIDFATLTGAIVSALGDDIAGVFTNEEKLWPQIKLAGAVTGEKTWLMPLEAEYDQYIKSDFADLRNIGTIRFADAVHAANFLKNFVSGPWIHFDIAGVAWATREKPYRPKGATGTGVRLAIEFLKNFRK